MGREAEALVAINNLCKLVDLFECIPGGFGDRTHGLDLIRTSVHSSFFNITSVS